MDERITLSGFDSCKEYERETAERIIQPVFTWLERVLGGNVHLKITHKQTHQQKHTLLARVTAEGYQQHAEVTGYDLWQTLSAVLEKLKNGVQHAQHA